MSIVGTVLIFFAAFAVESVFGFAVSVFVPESATCWAASEAAHSGIAKAASISLVERLIIPCLLLLAKCASRKIRCAPARLVISDRVRLPAERTVRRMAPFASGVCGG